VIFSIHDHIQELQYPPAPITKDDIDQDSSDRNFQMMHNQSKDVTEKVNDLIQMIRHLVCEILLLKHNPFQDDQIRAILEGISSEFLSEVDERVKGYTDDYIEKKAKEYFLPF